MRKLKNWFNENKYLPSFIFRYFVLPFTIMAIIFYLLVYSMLTCIDNTEKNLKSKDSSIVKEVGKWSAGVVSEFIEGVEEGK